MAKTTKVSKTPDYKALAEAVYDAAVRLRIAIKETQDVGIDIHVSSDELWDMFIKGTIEPRLGFLIQRTETY